MLVSQIEVCRSKVHIPPGCLFSSAFAPGLAEVRQVLQKVKAILRVSKDAALADLPVATAPAYACAAMGVHGQTITGAAQLIPAGAQVVITSRGGAMVRRTAVQNGDFDCDGTVAAADTTRMRDIMLGLLNLDAMRIRAGCIDGIDDLSSANLLTMARYLSGDENALE